MGEPETPGLDSLFILPLRIIPFKTETLARSRLVRNNHLVGVIELYSARETGSGHVAIEDLPHYFQWKEGAAHSDLSILRTLASLPSYDVYCLRRFLREKGVPINDYNELKLSEKKSRQLAGHMRRFTLPLVQEIYGDVASTITRFEDLVGLFKNPDVEKARASLQQMAERLKISINLIPRFIEDYGDIFMSLSYYHHCLDDVAPPLRAFLLTLNDMRTSLQVRNNRSLISEMDWVEKSIVGLVNFLKRMFHDFGVMSQDMWNDLSATKFERMKAHIEEAQVKVGGVLCGLTVKMNAWSVRFPNPKSCGPGAKGEFIMTDMRQGLAELITIARATTRANA